MKAVKKINVQDWMISEEVSAVMRALNDESQQALFVGGCVRNALLGEVVEDIDIATKLTPDVVTQRLEAAGIKVVPTGIEHGTVTAVVEGKPFEITTLRTDIETDGRRAVVAFAQDWAEDAQRRDFTMNTLLADQEGQIYDPTGEGLKDLENRTVRFVGDPTQRIREDYLRILRYFRFHAYYGDGPGDESVNGPIEAEVHGLKKLSKERVTQEFLKIILNKWWPETVGIMAYYKVIEVLFDTEFYCDFVTEHDDDLALELEARLCMLIFFNKEDLKIFDQGLVLSSAQKKRMRDLINVFHDFDLSSSDTLKEAMYRHSKALAKQVFIAQILCEKLDEGFIEEGLALIDTWDVPVFPLSGEDLIKEGFKPGPALGQELARREAEWIASGFKLLN